MGSALEVHLRLALLAERRYFIRVVPPVLDQLRHLVRVRARQVRVLHRDHLLQLRHLRGARVFLCVLHCQRGRVPLLCRIHRHGHRHRHRDRDRAAAGLPRPRCDRARRDGRRRGHERRPTAGRRRRLRQRRGDELRLHVLRRVGHQLLRLERVQLLQRVELLQQHGVHARREGRLHFGRAERSERHLHRRTRRAHGRGMRLY
mmetsp:Transcript_22646/g.58246  ORF Transcript_22646/g.58246 Transcript_22646/m.58246 type:complete len:203 (-) Transcript_22646:749-1357(-)